MVGKRCMASNDAAPSAVTVATSTFPGYEVVLASARLNVVAYTSFAAQCSEDRFILCVRNVGLVARQTVNIAAH